MPSARLSLAPGRRRLLHRAGSVLALGGAGFMAVRMHAYWGEAGLERLAPSVQGATAALALLYGAANVLLALAWRALLAGGGFHVARAWALRAYGTSQLSKYLPGNVFHLAGRQALGMAAGLPAGPFGKSMLWELLLLAAAGAAFACLALPLALPGTPAAWCIVLLGIGVCALTALAWRLFGRHGVSAVCFQLGFLAIAAAIFVMLLAAIDAFDGAAAAPWILVGGAYVTAWLIGLATPGAPAGAGVRELILLFLLRDLVHERDLLLAVVLGRVVTVGGDLSLFLLAGLLPASTPALKTHDAK